MRSLLRHPNLDGDTPLHVAARAGHFSILSFLIAEISSLSWIDIENERNRGIEILRWRNRRNNTVLHEAVRNHHVAVVELLIKVDPELACSRNNAGESPLYLAARDGMVEIVNQILNQILRLAPSCAHGGSDGQTALHAAIVGGRNDIMEMLLRVEPQLISESDDHGWTPLHCAASLGDEKTVGQLLELDITTVYILDKHGQSPLHVAASKGHTNVIKQIIRSCPDSGELLDLNGRNALHVAVLNGKVNVVRIDQRAKNRSGQTPIDIDNSIGESCTSPRIQISKIWRQLSIPRTWTVREKILPSPNQEEASATIQAYKKMGHTLLMVDTLIATVTFAAAFTMPGGYNNDIGPNQGLALLASSKYLKWFIISDTIAMVCSITAACIIFWGAIIGRESYGYYFLSATGLTYIALQSTALAFTNELEELINQTDADGNTPLHLATVGGKSRMIRYLMWDDRVDQRAKNKSGQTPIDIVKLIGEPNTSPQNELATSIACLHRALACSSLSLSVSSFTAPFTIAKSISISFKTLNSSVINLSSTFPSSLSTSASSLALSTTISPALASSAVEPNSLPISPSSFSKKSIITYPFGFSSGISLVLFHPISKLGGSGFTSPVRDFLSRTISDFLRFSIGKLSGLMAVSEAGAGIGKSDAWSG
ncbi:hypothetical protein F0562_010158 [Nyssa sinensis]|uniref:PGG domain-containing protein n=1 Tax=Nyssa sinensis TaxID=561372 RepID=A0A5J4ZY29_9ASTE|nr:hypothetical protein F0562_010158 [Nyssa sinensis]